MPSGPYKRVSAKREDLAYRNDLAESVVVFLTRPDSREEIDEFFEFLAIASGALPDELETVPPLDRTVAAHAYEIPPAVGTWTEIALILWENGKPILENVSMLAGAAQGIRWIVNSATKWGATRQERIAARSRQTDAPIAPLSDEQGYFLSQAAVTVLIVADLVDRFGYQGDLSIATHPRGYAGYNDPEHPNHSINYLIECRFAGRVIAYVADSKANVLEHFEVTERGVVPLRIPNLMQSGDFLLGSEPGSNGLAFDVGP
jgi:hypothetical protein